MKCITDEPLLSVASSLLVDINLDLRDEHKESRILDFNTLAALGMPFGAYTRFIDSVVTHRAIGMCDGQSFKSSSLLVYCESSSKVAFELAGAEYPIPPSPLVDGAIGADTGKGDADDSQEEQGMDALDHERDEEKTEEEVELYLYPIKEKVAAEKVPSSVLFWTRWSQVSGTTNASFDLVNMNVTSRGNCAVDGVVSPALPLEVEPNLSVDENGDKDGNKDGDDQVDEEVDLPLYSPEMYQELIAHMKWTGLDEHGMLVFSLKLTGEALELQRSATLLRRLGDHNKTYIASKFGRFWAESTSASGGSLRYLDLYILLLLLAFFFREIDTKNTWENGGNEPSLMLLLIPPPI